MQPYSVVMLGIYTFLSLNQLLYTYVLIFVYILVHSTARGGLLAYAGDWDRISTTADL